jgi:hypothetical protein
MRNRRYVPWALAAGALLAVATPALAGPGQPDVRFGAYGLATVPLLSAVAAFGSPDGSTRVVGQLQDYAIATVRMEADGTAGTPRPIPDVRGQLQAAAATRDGGLLLVLVNAMPTEPGRYTFGDTVVAKIAAAGTLDPAFGTLGLSDVVARAEGARRGFWVTALTELADGRILVGLAVDDPSIPTAWDYASQGRLLVLSATGEPLGTLTTPIDALAERRPGPLRPLPDGRLAFTSPPWCCARGPGPVMVRAADGALSAVPGSDGTTDFVYDAARGRLLLLSNVASATVTPAVSRITLDGRVDPTFGTSGDGRVALSPAPAYPEVGGALVAGAAGDVMAVRIANTQPFGPRRHLERSRLIVERVSAEGRRDSTSYAPGGEPILGDPERSWRWTFAASLPTGTGDTLVLLNGTPGSTGRPSPGEPPGAALLRLQGTTPATGSGTFGFAAPTLRVGEARGERHVQVLRSGGARGAITLTCEPVPGTAGAEDVSVRGGTLTWDDGDATPRTIVVSATDDARLEGEETLKLRLSPAGAAQVRYAELAITIEDDEALRALVIEPAQLRIRAGGSTTLRVHAPAGVPGPVSAYLVGGDVLGADGAVETTHGYWSLGGSIVRLQWPAGDGSPREIPAEFPGSVSGETQAVAGLTDAFGPLGDATGWKVARVTIAAPASTAATTPSADASSGGGGSLGRDSLAALLLLAGLRAVRRREAWRLQPLGSSACGSTATSTLSTRVPSMSTTSTRRSRHSKASPAFGIRPVCHSTKPATVV